MKQLVKKHLYQSMKIPLLNNHHQLKQQQQQQITKMKHNRKHHVDQVNSFSFRFLFQLNFEC